MAAIDYRNLLFRYIQMLKECGDYARHPDHSDGVPEFTPEERAELRRLIWADDYSSTLL